MSLKTCSLCGKEWTSVEEIVHDCELKLNGYQAGFKNPENGLILMTHDDERCNSTLAFSAGIFKSLYQGPEHLTVMTGKPGCEGKCLRVTDFSICEAPCSLAWVRHALQHLQLHRTSQDSPDHESDDQQPN